MSHIDILRAVKAGDIYRVEQRTATYAISWKTGHRCTREIKKLEAAGLVYLTNWGRDGKTRDYGLTDAGHAVLASHPEDGAR
jgi:predicted MarR family transcription regulator